MARQQAMAVLAFFFALTALQSFNAAAKEFVVGDDKGWTVGFNYTEWAEGKEFIVGDTLVFNYQAGSHDVNKVDGQGFRGCEVAKDAEALVSGKDVITLKAPGNKWYICSKPGHCAGGQKLVITVHPGLEAPSSPPVVPPTSGSSERIAMAVNFMMVAVAMVLV